MEAAAGYKIPEAKAEWERLHNLPLADPLLV